MTEGKNYWDVYSLTGRLGAAWRYALRHIKWYDMQNGRVMIVPSTWEALNETKNWFYVVPGFPRGLMFKLLHGLCVILDTALTSCAIDISPWSRTEDSSFSFFCASGLAPPFFSHFIHCSFCISDSIYFGTDARSISDYFLCCLDFSVGDSLGVLYRCFQLNWFKFHVAFLHFIYTHDSGKQLLI